MKADELKEYLKQKNNLIILLEHLGCHKIKEYETQYRCALPNKNNGSSICIYKDTLSIKIYNQAKEKGDIFTLYMLINDVDFGEANKNIHKLFNLEYKFTINNTNKTKKTHCLELFRKIKKKKRIDNSLEIIDNNLNVLPYIHIKWVNEGISPKCARDFGIGYDVRSKRITIPHRLWYGDKNDFVGIIGRTTIENYDLLDIPKYFPLKSYKKSLNVYGLQENYQTIQQAGYVVVYEAEKSVLKRYSKYDKTGVAICCHTLSDEQVAILISLNVEIIIAYDKGIDLDYIKSECERFNKSRKVSYIYDNLNLLKDKESPADAHNKVYEYLFNNRKEL